MGLWQTLRKLRTLFQRTREASGSEQEATRRCLFENMEERLAFSAAPIALGGVYIEQDSGGDHHGDRFEITFQGGANGTQLTRIEINGDHEAPGLGFGDMIFDTAAGSLGADEAHGFQIESSAGIDSVKATVVDGSSKLVLEFTGFDAGEKLVFSIDVDEIQDYDAAITDPAIINQGIDPIASGVEFQGSLITGSFFAPNYVSLTGSGEFRNQYDPQFLGSTLDLPADDFENRRDRSAGAIVKLEQQVIPARIGGHVYVDRNINGSRESGETPISGVTMRIIPLDTIEPQAIVTVQTDAQGRYDSGDIMPGRYRIEEIQPLDYRDGLDSAGTVRGSTIGRAVNPGDAIEEIPLKGGDAGINYDFGEYVPSIVSGYVYHDRNDNGSQDELEEPIPGVTIQIFDAAGTQVASQVTDLTGFYKFPGLSAGTYRVGELQPEGWLDGRDAPGRINGQIVGLAVELGDEIRELTLPWGSESVRNDFGELRPGSIRGIVFVENDAHEDADHDHDDPHVCLPDADDRRLAGVTIELLDASGKVVATTLTNAAGEYEFANLRPGSYSVRETQPANLFHGGQSAGSGGGDASQTDRIAAISLASGENLFDYNFCEIEPVSISGYVFRDGSTFFTSNGEPPDNWRDLRDGKLTSDDLRLPNVTLELRNALTQEIVGTTSTNAEGYYEFTALPPGTYSVYETQPVGYFDGIDTPGTLGGNATANDAIVNIVLSGGTNSLQNNFSELEAIEEIKPIEIPEEEPPIEPAKPATFIPILPQRTFPSVLNEKLFPYVAPPESQAAPVIPYIKPAEEPAPQGGASEYSWHLSVVNGGTPRETKAAARDARLKTLKPGRLLELSQWRAEQMRAGRWNLSQSGDRLQANNAKQAPRFGLAGAIPLTGDFNGDGASELVLYHEGEWFIDLNGNGQWDEHDLWAKLGTRDDQPVVGDWDGDGKDDIGIFGPQWPRDPAALERERGLPDSENRNADHAKNVPPQTEEAAGVRRLKLTREGDERADVIDHVLQLGSAGDVAISGDFNGDGIDTVGTFRAGKWRLDVNGDGRFDRRDRTENFGAKGDRPVVGDFNGDGIDELGIYRDGKWIVDTNNNGRIDAADQVFQYGGEGEHPIAGDFNGDGTDEPGTYSPGDSERVARREK